MHNGQYAAHHLGVGRKQVAQREWDAQHPLPDRPLGQDLVNQVRSTVSHAPGATGGTESTAFTTEGNQLLMMAGLTPHSQKAVFQTTALQEILKLPDNITGQAPALLRKHVLEPWPVFFYQLIKQRVLGLMSLVMKWTNRPEVVLECIGWQDRESLCSYDKQPYPSTTNAVSAFTV